MLGDISSWSLSGVFLACNGLDKGGPSGASDPPFDAEPECSLLLLPLPRRIFFGSSCGAKLGVADWWSRKWRPGMSIMETLIS